MVVKDEEKAAPRGYGRFRDTMRRNALLNTAWRVGVFTVGATVALGGLVMMITPGPGMLGIIVGLAILATEFAWARRALNHAKAAAERAKERALDPRRRRRNLVLGVTGGLVAGAAIVGYLAVYDFVLPWQIQDVSFWD
ncbi:PGPGW domain-containing protein [Actinomadura sediminis]|uniref:PGPGW domain-containing protein n=1 Tax=Actinomadura sediminis TaxID=1038904 RepID=A0ABW3EFR6_9ACTN